MKHILFVCTGNSCRSVMAEGVFRKQTDQAPGAFHVSSAGINAIDGFSATPDTLHVLEAQDIDMSGHQSRRLTTQMVQQADKIFVMEALHRDWIVRGMPEAAGKVELLMKYSSQKASEADIPDPIRMSGEFYKNTLSVISDCVKNVVASLTDTKR